MASKKKYTSVVKTIEIYDNLERKTKLNENKQKTISMNFL